MKVKNIISKVVDNYYPIVVEVFNSDTGLIEERYTMEAHAASSTHIPKNVLEMEVEMVIPFFNTLTICVTKERR